MLIDPKSAVASFDVDAQNTFTPLCPHELPVPEGHTIASELNAQAVFASIRVGSKDAHNPHAIWLATSENPSLTPIKGENVDLRWASHAMAGTYGFQLIPGLPKVTEYDYFVWKGIEPDMHPYGACYHDFSRQMSTGVIEFLKAKKISTILVGGLATDYCVKNTALELVAAGFCVILNLAACRGIAKNTTEAALNQMKEAGILFIQDSTELSHRAGG